MTPDAVFKLVQVKVDVRKCWAVGCVRAISHCTFLYLQYICLYHTCVLRSEFGHVWLRTTLDYLLKLLYSVCKFLHGWRSYDLIPFYFVQCMCLYIFLQLFVGRIVP